METTPIIKKPRRSNLRRMTIWTVLVLVLVSSMASVPMDVAAQAPGNKDITFYFHNCTSSKQVGAISTMRVMNTTIGDNLNTTTATPKAVQTDWYLYPVLANATAIQGNVTVHINAMRLGVSQSVILRFWLYDVDASGIQVATIASASRGLDLMTTMSEYSVRAQNVPLYNISKGHTMRLYFELDGSSSNSYSIAFGDSDYRSRVVIEMSEYVRVSSVDTLDNSRVPRTVFPQLVSNKTIIFNANITDPYGGYDIALVNATLVDPYGSVVLDEVLMKRTWGFFNSFHSEYEVEWNYTGYPAGQYNLTVEAVDWSGYNYRFPTDPGDATYGGHKESLTVSFWIGGRPHDVNVTVTDDLGQALNGAMVVLPDTRGVTDGSGFVKLQVANGTYDLEVLWQDTVVHSSSIIVSGDTNVSVRAAVYSPTIVCIDDVGDPVLDAVVFTTHPNGSVLDQSWRTNATGSIDWTSMAGGNYRVSVFWMGVEVHNATLALDGQGPFTLVLKVYQLDITVVDSAGQGLELAQVVIVNTTNGLVADSKLTDFAGETVSKVPIGSFDFRVYWRNELVFDDYVDYLVDRSGPLVLAARIFAVDLIVVDASDLPLTNARVVVGFAISGHVQDFGTTDDAGVLGTRLPVGYYNLWVYWKDVLVNETRSYFYDGRATHTILASVYWVNVHVQDTEGAPLVSALVTLRHADGLDFGTVSTDDAGNTSYRLPIGDYRIVVVWKETVVYDGTHHVDSQSPIVLTVAVYYMRLHVVDSRNVPVENALVATTNLSSDAIVGSSVTDASGDIVHRVPVGIYRVQIVWQEAVVHEADRTVDHNDPVTIVVNVFYVDIHVADTLGAPLDGAMISFINDTTGRSMGTQGTGDNGNVSYRTPIGDYQLMVVWQESVVHESLERVDVDRMLNITAAVYYAFIECVDTTDASVTGASVTVTNPATGRIMGSTTTDPQGKVTYRLPMDNYSIEVVWQETVVYASVHRIDNNDPLVIVVAVYYAEMHVVDSTHEPLESALVTFTNATSGRQMGEHTTPSSGVVTFRLPMGLYEIEVIWQEAVVWSSVHNLDDNDPITIVADVYYAELHVMDSTEAPLESSLVIFTNSTTGRLMGERSTPSDGIVTFRLPIGTYDVVVIWQEAMVWHAVRLLDDNEPWSVVTNVFYAQLYILDSTEVPVETALVRLTNTSSDRPMGDRTTGADGLVVYRLPMGVYTVQVLWKDTMVFDDYVTVDSNVPHEVIVFIYYPTFSVSDSQGVAVEGALVTMAKWPSGRIMGSQLTDGEGSITFRMPMGTYTVSVVWLDTLVHKANYGVEANRVFQVGADVYYADLTARDSRAVGLEFAQIGVVNSTNGRIMASHTADTAGSTQFRLPIGVYDVGVTWQNTVVYSEEWTVGSDLDEVLACWVYYVTYHVADVDDIDLADASVALSNAAAMTTYGPVYTDAAGEVEFRLPVGEVSIEVVWRTVTVYTDESVPVHADATEEIDAWVYYLTVQVTGSDGVKLKGAMVTVDRAGAAFDSAMTPKNGTLVFRLPVGGYWANMSFTTTYYLTPIKVSKSQQVDLNADQVVSYKLSKEDYPIPFYKTNLFYVILVLVLLILGLVFLLLRIRKMAMEGEVVPEEEVPEKEGSDLDDLLEDLGKPAAAGAAAGASAQGSEEDADEEVEEYSDDDLEEDTDEEPEEYSDEDLEK